MKDDPKSAYVWAKSFAVFSPNQDAEELKEKFWISIDEYLQHEATKMKGAENAQNDVEEKAEIKETNEDVENAYNFEKTI